MFDWLKIVSQDQYFLKLEIKPLRIPASGNVVDRKKGGKK